MTMPTIFVGHGSPMMALEDSITTQNIAKVGEYIIHTYGKPKAILSISAHWYTKGTYINNSPLPQQIYDMYGFPKELYEVQYRPNGDPELARSIQKQLGNEVTLTSDWGIDHGMWTVLVHMFPRMDIPVVPFSINGYLSGEESYTLAKKLQYLREEGILIIGSGNIVHNLRTLDYNLNGGTKITDNFKDKIVKDVTSHSYDDVIHFEKLENIKYVAPTPDHYLPLVYILATTTEKDSVLVFNDYSEMGTLAMTSFLFEKKD